jgi:beta-carotene 3-hydroxylase
MHPAVALAILVLTVAATEAIAWAVHRWLMHGIGWIWHRSHHQPDGSRWERNDAYSVLATVAVVALFVASGGPSSVAWWVAMGATVYGALYAIVHDGLAHRRWPAGRAPRRGWIARLVHAHRLHHAVRERDGAVSFGFLWAPPPERLARALRDSGAARRADAARTDARR